MTYVLLDTKQYFPSYLETKYGTILFTGLQCIMFQWTRNQRTDDCREDCCSILPSPFWPLVFFEEEAVTEALSPLHSV